MRSFPPEQIRNVALLGHSGSGKTTLTEALLAAAGLLERPGTVEAGTTVTDHDPEEARRRMSLEVGVAPLVHGDHRINLLDAPGYLDFVAEQQAALAVADLALVVVSAADGPEVGTDEAWRLAGEAGVAVMVCLTKLDRERASFDAVVRALRDRYGPEVLAAALPLGAEAALAGTHDVLGDAPGPGSAPGLAPPEGAAARHDELVEAAVVADDELMERYLEGAVPELHRLDRALRSAVAARAVVPVTCAVPTTGVGVAHLLDLVVRHGPSPADVAPVPVTGGGQTVEVGPDPQAPPLAYVYKTVADPYVGKVSCFRVLSGSVAADDHLRNPRTGAEERLHALFELRGKEHTPLERVGAGDLAAVAKLADTHTGDTLGPPGTPVVVAPPPAPEPVYALAIVPRSAGDEDKLMTALHRLQEEDRALGVRRDDETHQTLLWGMGDTHLAVVIERLHRRFGVEVDTEEAKVAYRETVTAGAEAEGRHKKQSGGHGQFGVVSLRIEPLARGGGFEFVDRIVGGAIPRALIPAVEKGVVEAMAAGGVHGFPVVDVRATAFDGKFHPVDSSELSFKLAAGLAFREALTAARPVLLEPVSTLEVTVPQSLQGDVMGDLNSRRGRVLASEVDERGDQHITAQVPTSELRRYAIDLRSMTGGHGRFRAAHSHYDPVPSQLTSRLVGSTA